MLSTVPRICAKLLVALALLGVTHPDPAGAANAATVASSTTVVTGALPNGLRYTLLPHRRDLGRVSVRLVVHAGSLDERDGERGFAHFVEHLAFQGSRNFPPGKVREFLQSLGLADGADLNAHTGFTHTTYKIDLPAGRASRLAEALRVLRDFADGAEFPAAEVMRERGVVLSEAAARDTDDLQIMRQRVAALYPGTPLAARFPIGERADLEGATAESLRAFYRRCYAPARMAVVVTGDIEAEAARRLVAEHFASLRPDATAAPQVLPPDPVLPGALRAHTIVSADALAANFAVIAVERFAPKSKADYRAAWVSQIALDALNQRLRARRAQEPARFGTAAATRADGADGRFAHFGIEASAATDDWPAAASLLETELRRAVTHGFAPAEVQEMIAGRLAWARAAVDEIAGETPDLLATKIATALAAGIDWPHPAAMAAHAAEFAPTITAEETAAALRTLFAPERLHFLLTRRDAPAGGAEAILAAWRESAARAAEPAPPPAAPLAFRYEPAAQPGTVASRRTEADLGIELVAFANGARLNLRASRTEPGRFRLAARLGRGLVDFPRERPGLPHLAAHSLKDGDLGRHTREEIQRLLHMRALSSHVTFDHRFLYEISGPVAELPFALQLITVEFSDTKPDIRRFAKVLSDTSACRSGQLDDGAAHAREGIVALMAGGDSRLREPPPTWNGDYTFAEVNGWLAGKWLDGPLEVALTGDFEPAAVIAAGAASIGTLGRRLDPTPTSTGWPALRAQPDHEVQNVPLADKAAAVRLAWPVRDVTGPAQRHALKLATDILIDRYRHSLREELGVTYSPDGGIHEMALHHAFAFASVALTFPPERAPDLTRRALALAEELARTGATPEEFARLREPLRAAAAEAQHSNEWWLDEVLADAQSDPASLAEARAMAGGFDRLTLGEVNRAAADHFGAGRGSSLIILPLRAPSSAPGAEPATSAEFAERAYARTNAGDLDGALADFERALALDPKNDHAYANRSATRMLRGDPDGAMADCTQALALNPRNAMAYANRGIIKFALGAVDSAMGDFNQAIEHDPKLALAYANRAGARYATGDPAGCIADANRALELDPKIAMAHVNRGVARGQQGDSDGAIADFTQAIALHPRYDDAFNNRGLVRQGNGDLDGALQDYDRAIALNPRAVQAHANRGAVHQTKGRLEAALADYDRALELFPNHVLARFNRSLIRQQRRDLAGALEDVEHYIRLVPQNPDAFNNRGFIRQTRGDLDGAIADYTKAIELRPNYPLAFRNRAEARQAKGDRAGAFVDRDRALQLESPLASRPATPPPAAAPARRAKPETTALIRSASDKRSRRDLAGARADLDKAVAGDPDYPDVYVIRAGVRMTQNDLAGALADTDKAITLRPTFAGAFIQRGMIRRQQSDYAAALADLNRAIALDPKLSGAFYNRGLVHDTRRDWRAAIADYDEAIKLSPSMFAALNARGYSRQQINAHSGAIADFTAALKLSETFTVARFNRAVSLRASGDLAGALTDLDRVLEQSPNYTGARTNRACVRDALGDHDGAAADYDAEIARTSGPAAFTRLFRWINHRRLDPGAPAADFARAVASWPDNWEKTAGRFLLGEITEEAFLAESQATAGNTPGTRTTDSCYLAGVKRLLDGDAAGAGPLFQRSISANMRVRFAHTLARAELARLRQ